jgi:uncharacterized delta-60 repeat protein
MMKCNKHLYIIAVLIPLLCTQPLHATIPPQYIYAWDGTLYSTTPYIDVFNGSTNSAVGSFLGQTATGVVAPGPFVITPNSKYMYVGDLIGSIPIVNIIDLSNNVDIATIAASDQGTLAMACTPDGQYLYTLVNDNNGTNVDFAVLNLSTNQYIAGSPFPLPAVQPSFVGIFNNTFIAINPTYPAGNNFVVGASQQSNPMVVPFTINTVTGVPTIGTPFAVGANNNCSLAFKQDGSMLYVLNIDSSGNNLYVYPVNPSTFAVGTGIFIGNTAGDEVPSIFVAGNNAYVVAFGLPVTVIDLTTNTILTTIALGGAADIGALNADRSYLYIGEYSFAGPIQVINTATNTLDATISSPTTLGCIGVASKPNGILDTTFGNNGVTLTPVSRADTLQNAAIESISIYDPYDNNKIITTGSTQAIGGTPPASRTNLFLARYTSDGALDTADFNSPTGYQTLLLPSASACVGNALALDVFNNILVAGYSAQNPTSMLLARYTPAGTLDTTFPGGSGLGYTTLSIGSGATANAIGMQSVAPNAGKIIVGGTSVNNGVPSFTLARFNQDGTLDTSFGPNGTGYVLGTFGNISRLKALAIVGSSGVYRDYIVATGDVDNQIFIATYDNNGNLIFTFKPGIGSSSTAYSIAYAGLSSVFSPFRSIENLYIAGSAKVSGTNQSLLLAYSFTRQIPNVNQLNPLFNSSGTPGYILQPIANSSEFYSVTAKQPPSLFANSPGGNILCSGYAVGSLTNQLSVMEYTGLRFQDTRETSAFGGYWGFPNYYFNNNNGPTLTTIGNITAGQTVLQQPTAATAPTVGRIITAGTADGTFCVAGFGGE